MVVLWAADLALARLFGPELAGEYYVWWTIASIATIVSVLGLGEPLVREAAQVRGSGDLADVRGLHRGVLRRLAVSSSIATTALVVAAIVLNAGLGAILIALSVLPTTYGTLNLYAFRAMERPASGVVFANIIPSALFLVLLVSMSSVESFAAIGVALLAARSIGAALSAVGLRMILGSRGPDEGSGRHLVEPIGRAGRRLLLAQVSEYTVSWADLVLLAILATDTEVGVYAVCARLAYGLNMVQESVNARSSPVVARLHTSGPEGAGDVVRRLTVRVSVLGLVATAALIVGGLLVLPLFGDAYTTGRAAMAILAIAQFSQILGGPSRTYLAMTGSEAYLARVFAVVAVGNVAANAILIPMFGMNGAALATLAALWGRNLSVMRRVRALTSVSP